MAYGSLCTMFFINISGSLYFHLVRGRSCVVWQRAPLFPPNTPALSSMIWWYLCNLLSFFLRHKTDLKFLWEQSFTEWKLCHGIRKCNLEEINTFCDIFLIYPTVFIHHSKNSKPSFYTKVSVTVCVIGVHHLLLTGYIPFTTINLTRHLAELKWFWFCFYPNEMRTKLVHFSKGIPCALWLMISHIDCLLHIH